MAQLFITVYDSDLSHTRDVMKSRREAVGPSFTFCTLSGCPGDVSDLKSKAEDIFVQQATPTLGSSRRHRQPSPPLPRRPHHWPCSKAPSLASQLLLLQGTEQWESRSEEAPPAPLVHVHPGLPAFAGQAPPRRAALPRVHQGQPTLETSYWPHH